LFDRLCGQLLRATRLLARQLHLRDDELRDRFERMHASVGGKTSSSGLAASAKSRRMRIAASTPPDWL
jgi:hypothetical protein